MGRLHLKGRYLILFPVVMVVFMQGCLKEDWSDCVTEEEFLLTVKVVDVITGEDITTTAGLKNAVIYLFDEENSFIRAYRLTADQIRDREAITLPFSGRKSVGVSVWGDLNERIKVRDSADGIPDEAAVIVVEDPDYPGYDLCPNDFFFGWKRVSHKGGTVQREEVVIKQKNARLNIVVKGLDTSVDNYFFRISNEYNGYDFQGSPFQTSSVVREKGVFVPGADYLSPEPYLLIHSPERKPVRSGQLWIRLCRDEQGGDLEIAATNQDTTGNYITLSSGETTNVLIDLRSGLSGIKVYVQVTPWNEVYLWEEF